MSSSLLTRIYMPFARLSLFVIFFWFGLLKVLDVSPASTLVQALFEETLSFMSFPTFLILFGLFEMLIGILFLIRGAEKVVLIFFLLHIITTFLPLCMVPAATWSGFLTPTLEGQYIIKNLALIAVAVGIFTSRESRVMSQN